MNNPDLLFSKNDLLAVLQNQEQKTVNAIEDFEANRLLNTNSSDLAEYFFEKYQIEPIKISVEQVSVSQAEVKIDVSQDPRRFIRDRSRPFFLDGTRVTYFVPFTGDKTLFYCRPSSFTFNPPRAVITTTDIEFIFDKLDHDVQAIQAQFQSELKSVQDYLKWIESDVLQFNNQLKTKIQQQVEARRQKILKDQGLVASLGFPIRQRENASLTYAVPITRKKIHTLPPATSAPYQPEPALEMAQYEHILSIITNMVLVVERSPDTFARIKEEELRQHFLIHLNGQYDGQATGETFNYQGKTDILIRQNGKNIFIAECKFWRGAKGLTDTIDQLLGYISWRDTKTAILVFNRSKQFSDVVAAIPNIVKQHPNFKRVLPVAGETNGRYVFRHLDDQNRELILTVMAFNIPRGNVEQ